MRLLALLIVIVLGACGAANPGVRLDAPARPPVAADVDWAELTFAGRGGVELYAQRWRPRGAVRGVVVIHHGLADHSTRYAAFADGLVRAGYAVWALDMRGHGRSAGARVRVDRIDDLVDDLETFVATVRATEGAAPLFVIGHSLGGLTAALYAIERAPDVAGVILSAPGIAFDALALQAAAIRFTARLAPDAPVLSTPHADFSASREVIAEMGRDPLIHQANGPARTARAAIDGVARVWAGASQLTAPLLAVHGTADKVTAPSGSRDLVARAGGDDRTLRLYDGLNHDLLHEPGGGAERVASDIRAWLDAHTGDPERAPVSSPPRRLRGDRGARALDLELDVRGERSTGDDPITGVTAGVRLRAGVGRATPLGLGWTGGVDLRAGALDGGVYEVDAHALGVALRSGGGAVLAVTGGVGVGGPRGPGATHVPVEASLEVPLGPARVLARAGLGWRLGGDPYDDDALGFADEATALVGVRLGRDVRYWATNVAGAGPVLAVTYRRFGGAELWGVAVGGELWGGN